MASLGPWDTVFGMANGAVNGLFAQIHAKFPNLLDLKVPVASNGLTGISIQLADALQLTMAGPGWVQVAGPVNIQTIGTGGGSTFGDFVANFGIADTNGDFTMAAGGLTFNVRTADPAIEALVNSAAAGPMNDLLTQNLLQPLAFPVPLPPGQYVPGDSELGADQDGDPIFLIFTANQWFTGTGGVGSNWTEGMFLGVTSAHLTALVSGWIGPIAGQGGIDSPNFSWTFDGTPTVSAVAGTPGSITLGFSLDASVTYHTSGALPNIAVSVPVNGSVTGALDFAAVAVEGGTGLQFTGGAMSDATVEVDISAITQIETGLTKAFQGPLGQQIVENAIQMIQAQRDTIYAIPNPKLTLAGQAVTLSLANSRAVSFQADFGPMIALAGDPTLS